MNETTPAEPVDNVDLIDVARSDSERFKETFVPALKKALLCVLGLYLVLFIYAFATGNKTQRALVSQLAQETVPIAVKEAPLQERTVKTVTTHSIDSDDHASDTPAATKAPAQTKDPSSLPQAPIDAVFEQTDRGPMPKVAASGLMPFDAYKKPFPLNASTGPVIALGVMDFGLSGSLARHALNTLPDTVTLMMSPYVTDAQRWVDLARQNGFEVWMHVPFETATYPHHDTGTETILKRSSLRLNMDRMLWAMSRASGYAGLYGQLDRTFDHSESMIKGLFNAAFMRGIGYAELDPTGNPYVENISVSHNAPYINVDLTFTYRDMPRAIDALIDQAKQSKIAIGAITVTPAVIDELPSWINKIQDSGITLVPLSAAYDYTWTEFK